MIQAGLEFRPSAKQNAIAALLSLPSELRPTHASKGESERGTPIRDVAKFLGDVHGRDASFFLKSDRVNYYLNIVKGELTQCSCFLKVEPILAKNFLTYMAAVRPLFGYACLPAERERRNRLVNQIGQMSIES